MAVDIIARALAASLQNGEGGTIPPEKLPPFHAEGLTAYAVGGIPQGVDLNGKNIYEILTMMLYGTLNPLLMNPSLRATVNPLYAIIGDNIKVRGVAIYDRGSIKPAYGTSGFRAGEAISYTINGEEKSSVQSEYAFELDINSVARGDNMITISVKHAAGEQPKNSAGEDYDKPYPAGVLNTSVIVHGVYPLYVSDSNGSLQQLPPETQVGTEGYIEVTVAPETGAGVKQKIAIPETISEIKGIKQFDNSRNVWDWIYGTPEKSLTAFNKTQQQIEVLGQMVNYVVYENALTKIGERKLRFFTNIT